jgi:imidazoleglycerol-phosphate dehydratase (EC 4.2.1.19)
MSRKASLSRVTSETTIQVDVELDGVGEYEGSTGLPFFDHMLAQLTKHSRFDLSIRAKGDLDVDAHHLVEDVGLALGKAIDEALGDRHAVSRFASVAVPLDEALVEVALDLSGRPMLVWRGELPIGGGGLGTPPFDPQLTEEFWRAFCTTSRITLHVILAYGRNAHHLIEALFKAVARALGSASRITGEGIPSTKGVL